MTMGVLLTEGSSFSQSCKVHCYLCACVGEYLGPVIQADQDFVFVEGALMVRSGTVHTYGCGACSSDRVIQGGSDVLFIEGVAVNLDSDPVTGLHTNGPVSQEDPFVFA